MDSLVSRDKAEAKKKGLYAAAAWGGTVLLGVAASPVLWIPAAAGAGYLTWKWFVFRAKRADRVKLIFWDGNGMCLFGWRPSLPLAEPSGQCHAALRRPVGLDSPRVHAIEAPAPTQPS